MNDKKLELKVTIKVANGTADGAAANLRRNICKPGGGVRIGIATGTGSGIQVTGAGIEIVAIERADGKPLGLVTEFEEYWRESHCEGSSERAPGMWSETKIQAWGAYRAAYDIYKTGA